MTLPKKFETICFSDGDREILTIELLIKTIQSIKISYYYKPSDGNWESHCDHLQALQMPQWKTNFTLLQEMLT